MKLSGGRVGVISSVVTSIVVSRIELGKNSKEAAGLSSVNGWTPRIFSSRVDWIRFVWDTTAKNHKSQSIRQFYVTTKVYSASSLYTPSTTLLLCCIILSHAKRYGTCSFSSRWKQVRWFLLFLGHFVANL